MMIVEIDENWWELTTTQRQLVYDELIKGAIRSIKVHSNGRIIKLWEAICVFHNMQTQVTQIYRSFKAYPDEVKDEIVHVHRDHFHIVFLFSPDYGKSIMSRNFMKNAFKPLLMKMMRGWSVKTKPMMHSNSAVEYLFFKHKYLTIWKQFSPVEEAQELLKNHFLPIEKAIILYQRTNLGKPIGHKAWTTRWYVDHVIFSKLSSHFFYNSDSLCIHNHNVTHIWSFRLKKHR